MSDLVQEIIDTGKAIAQSTTAVLRHAKFVSLSGEVATIELGGGQVQANMLFAGATPTAGSEVLVLQQGYELVVIGPLSLLTQTDADTRYVKKTGDTITNASRLASGLIVERTEAAQSTSDADILQVRYGGKRTTWVNEKGNLRTSNDGSPAEDAFKIIGDPGITGNFLQIVDSVGNSIMRIGALGRANFSKGLRMVGDTLQIRDSTEADESTISQPLGGDLTIAPKRNLSVSGKKVSNVAEPTVTTDAATKNYVDTADALKAPLASPTFTGDPKAPTPAVGDNDTSIATTAFVNAEIANDAPTKTGGGASGTWGISITGNAATATSAGNADTTDGLHVHPGRNNEANKIVRTDGSGYLQAGYINSSFGNENNAAGPPRVWGTNGSDDYLRTYQAGYLSNVHSHNRTGAGYQIAHVDVGSLAANTAYGPATFGHSNPQGINGATASGTYDDNTHSIVAGIGNLWDSVNIKVVYRNVGDNAESCAICVVVFA